MVPLKHKSEKALPTVGTIFISKNGLETAMNTLKTWAEVGVRVEKGGVRLQK
jgi:hypothetical protein